MYDLAILKKLESRPHPDTSDQNRLLCALSGRFLISSISLIYFTVIDLRWRASRMVNMIVMSVV